MGWSWTVARCLPYRSLTFQGNLCLSACSISFHSPWCLQDCFSHSSFPSLYSRPFLYTFSQRCHQFGWWAQLCPVVCSQELVRTIWKWLCPAQGSPWPHLPEARPEAFCYRNCSTYTQYTSWSKMLENVIYKQGRKMGEYIKIWVGLKLLFLSWKSTEAGMKEVTSSHTDATWTLGIYLSPKQLFLIESWCVIESLLRKTSSSSKKI